MIKSVRSRIVAACLLGGLVLASSAVSADARTVSARPAITARPVQSQTVTMHNPQPALAQPQAAAPASAQMFESQPLSFPSEGRRIVRDPQPRGATFSFGSLMSLMGVVAVACALFVGILYVAKKYLPGHKQLFSHPAMEVLGRTHLDQRRYVSLLRVGKRVLVVGVSPDEIHALSEITDEEEITAILEVARPKTEMGLTLFQRLFQRTVIDTAKAETKAIAQAEAENLAEQMSSLRNRVMAIRESEESSRHVDALG